MIGKLCEECNRKEQCQAFGISQRLISRLMIGKSVHDNTKAFPINIYKKEIEAERLDIQKTLHFLEEISPHCFYLK